MLSILTSKISSILNKFSSKNRLDDNDIKLILRDFRKTLLDSDVSWNVTKYFVEKIRIKLNEYVSFKSISPKDYFSKVVIEEFKDILSYSLVHDYNSIINKTGLNIVFFVGLNGVGKTTSLIKFANLLKDKEKKVLVVSCDIYRPAAIDQLSILSKNLNIRCFSDFSLDEKPIFIVNKAINYSKQNNFDFLIIDTAGRSQIDDFMMEELVNLFNLVTPSFSFLVIDSLVGQNGVNSALDFCKKINISGFFLTKMDSDSKGGVLLSVSFLTKKPIYFLGIGEAVTDLSFFYPDRIISRILGFGDVSSLLEEINTKLKINEDKNDFNLNDFNLNDFKKQLKYIVDFGGLTKFLDKLPGAHNIDHNVIEKFDNNFFLKMIYIIDSMTKNEKKYPSIINGSRKRRISIGAGVNILDVNKMLKYYDKMKKTFSRFNDEKSLLDFLKKKKF